MRHLALCLVCLTLIATGACAQTWSTIYSTNFDNSLFTAGKTVDSVDGWQVWTDSGLGNASQVTVQKEPDPSTNQLMYIGSYSSTSAVHPIGPNSERVRLSFTWEMMPTGDVTNANLDAYGTWIMLTDTPNPSASPRSGMITSLYDPNTGIGRLMAYNQGTGPGTGWVQYGNFNIGTKYNFTMDVNLATKTYDVYVDGSQLVSGYNIYSPSESKISYMIFRRRYKSGEFAIDNVTVEATPEPSSLLALGCGIVGMAGVIRRRRAA